MAFYYSSNFPDENGYYTQIPYDSRYYYSSYYPPSQSFAGISSYEYLPSPSIVAYSALQESYSNPVSTEYVVYHSVAKSDDVDFEEYDPHPFGGGYDIAQTYGKPLPPSDEICYPPSSFDPKLSSPDNLPHEKEAEELKTETQVAEEEQVMEEEDDQPGDGDGSDEKSADFDSLQVYESQVVDFDQIPPGYGLEAFDLCENLFGYWPSLSRINKKCCSCGNEIRVRCESDDDKWKKTADYLFGSPDPYCLNPAHVYQMHYQHPSSALYEQADQYGQSSWFL